MNRSTITICIAALLLTATAVHAAEAPEPPQVDTIKTESGQIKITLIGHGTLMLEYGGKVIHIDPYSRLTDYAKLPQADLLLLTHEHGDHLDPKAVAAIRSEETVLILTKACAEKVKGGQIMQNGDKKTVENIKIEAVPAYNIVHMRGANQPYHPKGSGNGYVLTLGKTRVYIAGDTENTPEMKALEKIDIAFLPMNLPYTMTPEMAADAAIAFKPKILYPYHFGQTDPKKLVELLADQKDIEVRVRKMQ